MLSVPGLSFTSTSFLPSQNGKNTGLKAKGHTKEYECVPSLPAGRQNVPLKTSFFKN